ncbi:hypothetical protein HZS_5822 [Henneguya salminicola]|nr:hypothetical protein HZS_5822 [Henneguya salminicola]
MNSNTWQSFFSDGKSKMYFARSSILLDINTGFNNILYSLYLYSYITSIFSFEPSNKWQRIAINLRTHAKRVY